MVTYNEEQPRVNPIQSSARIEISHRFWQNFIPKNSNETITTYNQKKV